ncbi:NAD(P)-binding protein [Ophiobolus disseminans]|uniref:NAD(P)-binding protein n=1 Tax=Ophiobolus disseminans TaxID=1469910 RepID=A0A6A7A954_9PLEO|nr:NAD(P)-binding protein [Ophiobolus disseminans]
MIALTGATGKLGSAVLNAILDNKLVDPKDLVVCTASDPTTPKLQYLRDQSITLRHADFASHSTLATAYTGCTKLFLVSSPRADMDYNDAPLWHGREAHHRAAIDAALSVGVSHIYYTSLAFANPSKAGVMRAHVRTVKYLKDLESAEKVKVTILGEGLYNESWPLYLGYYFGLKAETRSEVVVAGDGRINWTSIPDMGFATAKIVAAPSEEWAGKTVYLCQKRSLSLQEVARIVSKIKGEEVRLKITGRKQYEDYYVEEKGMERPNVEWWSTTYDALKDGECEVDDPTLESILKEAGRTPKALEETIEEMLR